MADDERAIDRVRTRQGNGVGPSGTPTDCSVPSPSLSLKRDPGNGFFVSNGTLAERFWAKTDCSSTDGCWNWNGSRMNSGKSYGQVWHNRKLTPAHRVSWELANGPVPADFQVLHHCDNMACVRPSHLFLGHQTENMLDIVAKGRCYNAKLSNEQVREIRASTEPSPILAARYGITPGHVRKVRSFGAKAALKEAK